VRKLEAFNVAKEIAEVEKARQKQSQHETVPTIPLQDLKIPPIFQWKKPKVSQSNQLRGADRIRTDA
jgi:hypothetical protein